MTTVTIKKAVYSEDVLEPLIQQMLSPLAASRSLAGVNVLLKPNLLIAAKPDSGIVTHPMLVRQVALFLLDHGARVQVADSSAGMAGARKVFKETGLQHAFKDLDVDLRAFEASVSVDIGEPFGRIDIAREAMEADLVINLAKLKSHTQMRLTLGVKNMFGCIVGLRKPEWHMRAGVDRDQFARLLVRIYEAVAPAYTLVDGILALEGQGPGKKGRPRQLGLLIGGANAHAVDKTIATLLDLAPEKLNTYRQAVALGVFDGKVHVSGDLHIIDDFDLPDLGPLSFGPQPVNRFYRKYVIQKPVPDNQICKLCGECWKICPAKVISHNTKGIQIDYDRCIRCYCCIEVCPHAAISARRTILSRLQRQR